jgi:ribonuclease HII
MTYTIGVDEVGRGPIAGPLVVCACAVRDDFDILTLFPKHVLKDSKKLSEKVRIAIASQVETLAKDKTIIYSLGEVSAKEIDEHGLSQAIKTAVKNALDGVIEKGESHSISTAAEVYLDGSLCADEVYSNQETIIKGDEKIGQIALASIIAKVYRDTKMKELSHKFPNYGFENHVGYGTKSHYQAIKENGITMYHRKSFLKSII